MSFVLVHVHGLPWASMLICIRQAWGALVLGHSFAAELLGIVTMFRVHDKCRAATSAAVAARQALYLQKTPSQGLREGLELPWYGVHA
jgi:hypothetical protein